MEGVAYGWFALEGVKITASLRMRALLDIYGEQRKRRHCALSPRALEVAWRNTGMRRDDLRVAINDALTRHLLVRNGHHDYELTYIGEVAMQEGLLPSMIERAADWTRLQRLRLRRHRANASNQRLSRREGDPSAS